MTTIARPDPARSIAARIAAGARSEVVVARTALGVVALHIADDNFLQPNAGVSAADHLAGGLLLLAPLLAAIVFYPRLRAGARATVALLGGYLGVVAGTEAVYYTVEVGPSGDDFTGLLSIPAGLVLVGLGIVTLWRSRRRDDRLWWRYGRRLLLAVLTLVLVAFVFFPFVFSYVITHVARAHVPAPDLGAPYEDVELETSDGLLLKGWYIESQNGAAVISFPGRAGSQSRARMLADHGYGVLLFDRRGEGESEGDPNLLGWEGERDIHAAVGFLQSRPDVDPGKIGGVGLSVGGEMMIVAAAESGALKAIMIEGASGRSVRDDWANGGARWDVLVGRAIFTAASALNSSDLPPSDLKSLVPTIPGSVLFVYGERGQPEERPANEGWYEQARGHKEIWEVPGSKHMAGIEAQPQEYERRVVGFFDRTLLAVPES
jgi:dienelactone hydrolase